MNQQPTTERRGQADRRLNNLPIWHPRRLHGRRAFSRRDEQCLVDRVPMPVFVIASLLLIFTLIDGVITYMLLDFGCEEANPLMRYLLEWSPVAFFVGKYALTAAFLPVALVMNRYRLFGTRLRAGHLIPIVAGLYIVLIAYQAALYRDRLHALETRKPVPRMGQIHPRPRAASEG